MSDRTSRLRRLREQPALAPVWRAGVFLAGLLLVVVGFALAVVPGPLNLPFLLLGLWIWSTEFAWAQRWFAWGRRQATAVRLQARRRPVHVAAVTLAGMAVLGAVLWTAGRYQLVDRALGVVGL